MNRIVMISAENCPNCERARAEGQQISVQYNCRWIEYDVKSEESYNYDIEGTPQFYLEDSNNDPVWKSPPGIRGLQYLKEKL